MTSIEMGGEITIYHTPETDFYMARVGSSIASFAKEPKPEEVAHEFKTEYSVSMDHGNMDIMQTIPVHLFRKMNGILPGSNYFTIPMLSTFSRGGAGQTGREISTFWSNEANSISFI